MNGDTVKGKSNAIYDFGATEKKLAKRMVDDTSSVISNCNPNMLIM
jgi:hypothetical protein